ncbi:MAG TPA: metal-dependent hydrolase [Anaerolineae bacterium]|nr:metal-dependent hydrolase [Anaerolineae bacterium]HXW01138.1 metal-dependent hydrolase [Anaerolineae bacterium]
MLGAHLVPGYFAAVKSKSQWNWEWSEPQRILLWTVALGSTVIPDLDVIYNTLFRGFINHSVLWTHSLFPHLCVGLCWWLLYRTGRWPYLQTLVGLMVTGGLSHLALDVIAHGTPLFYPISLTMVGAAPVRVVEGGFWTYVTDPIFLLEPLLLTLAAVHWILTGPDMKNSTQFVVSWPTPNLERLGRINEWKSTLQIRALVIIGLISGLILFTITFLLLLSALQSVATSL